MSESMFQYRWQLNTLCFPVDPVSGRPCVDFLDDPQKWSSEYSISYILLSLQVSSHYYLLTYLQCHFAGMFFYLLISVILNYKLSTLNLFCFKILKYILCYIIGMLKTNNSLLK